MESSDMATKSEAKTDAKSEAKTDVKKDEGAKGGTVTTLKPRSSVATPAPAAATKKDDKQQALVPVRPAAGGKLLTEADLNKAVEKAKKLKVDVAEGFHALGLHIRENIYAPGLWKQRTVEGKAVYTGFEQFCQKELGLSGHHAYGLMDVAEKFTSEQVHKFGTTKLQLVLKAPAESQAEVLGDVEKGATVRELADKVKKKRGEKGNERRETGRKKTPAGEKEKAAKTGGRATITIAQIEGRKTVKLFARSPIKGEEPKRAKKVLDQPWGTLELSNNVTMKFLIQERDGELVLVVDTRRTDG